MSSMTLGPGEPAAGPWQVEALDDFARSLAGPAPRIIAVDGRGGSGKTVLAERLRRLLTPAAVVHSDDVAWAHSRFGWDDLMIDGILEPVRAGRGAHYRPTGWIKDGREGHLDVPADATTLILEGVGVSRRSLVPLLDVAVWVQSDYIEARERGVRRDIAELGRTEEDGQRLWQEWEDEEVPFLIDDRPWERADVIVATASSVPYDRETEVAVVRPPRPLR